MSHYSLTVCLPGTVENVEEALTEALAPFDENKEVEPYKDFEEFSPDNFWWINAVRQSAEEVANNDRSSVKPYDPDGFFSFASDRSKETEEEQWEKIKRKAEVYNSLPQPLTWKAVTEAYNRYYCDGEPYTDGTRLEYDPETGGAFEWSTYNPLSKFDWYSVGGRYSDKYLIKVGASGGDLVAGQPSWTLRDEDRKGPRYCDGGRKRALDLHGMRLETAIEAGLEWGTYHSLVGDLPEANPWSFFRSLADAGALTIETARERYRSQDRVKILKGHPTLGGGLFGPDPVDHYGVPREVFTQNAADKKVPGYCLLTLDGHWMAPGEMGGFGMSSDTGDEMSSFKAQANEYIDSLPDDTWIITVDLHI